MRVEIQQNIAQTVNVDRVQTNISNPQIAEAIRHTQNLSEQREAEKKSAEVIELSKEEKIDPVKDEDRKRKALLSKKEEKNQDDNKKFEEKENKGEEKNRAEKSGSKIDIRI
jgi:N12 class adenine-specific DNA methylase